MKRISYILLFWIFPTFAADYNQWVLDAINEMPKQGGYELTSKPVVKMNLAFSWNTIVDREELIINPKIAIPSYCTTATYMVFYKVLKRYWSENGVLPTFELLSLLKPESEADGSRMWGRWNSNGPGTAKFFYDSQIGENFDDISQARPGDFAKLYWNEFVGKKEKGHSVIYLGQETVNGVPRIKFWASSASTSGFGIKSIPKKDAIRIVFSRLQRPDNMENVTRIDIHDMFLASMLTRDSSWEELRTVSGIK